MSPRSGPGGSRRAQLGIDALGLPCYGPRERVWIRHARRRVKSSRPLFRAYVFVAFDIDRDDWGAVLGVKGVVGLLCCDPGVPSRVSAGEIEALRRAEQAGAFDATVDGLAFRPGDAVQVEAGAVFPASSARSGAPMSRQGWKSCYQVSARLFCPSKWWQRWNCTSRPRRAVLAGRSPAGRLVSQSAVFGVSSVGQRRARSLPETRPPEPNTGAAAQSHGRVKVVDRRTL